MLPVRFFHQVPSHFRNVHRSRILLWGICKRDGGGHHSPGRVDRGCRFEILRSLTLLGCSWCSRSSRFVLVVVGSVLTWAGQVRIERILTVGPSPYLVIEGRGTVPCTPLGNEDDIFYYHSQNGAKNPEFEWFIVSAPHGAVLPVDHWVWGCFSNLSMMFN
jgi:hypothetical protein